MLFLLFSLEARGFCYVNERYDQKSPHVYWPFDIALTTVLGGWRWSSPWLHGGFSLDYMHILSICSADYVTYSCSSRFIHLLAYVIWTLRCQLSRGVSSKGRGLVTDIVNTSESLHWRTIPATATPSNLCDIVFLPFISCMSIFNFVCYATSSSMVAGRGRIL